MCIAALRGRQGRFNEEAAADLGYIRGGVSGELSAYWRRNGCTVRNDCPMRHSWWWEPIASFGLRLEMLVMWPLNPVSAAGQRALGFAVLGGRGGSVMGGYSEGCLPSVSTGRRRHRVWGAGGVRWTR
jgi:hypothetical protein